MALARATSLPCRVLVPVVAYWWYLAWYAGEPVAVSGVLMHRLPWSPDNWTWRVPRSLVFSTASEIMCAATCQQTSCVAYNFSDGVCAAEGVSGKDLSIEGKVSSMFRTFTNAAFGKAAYARSQYSGAGPGNAVDDKLCQKWSSSYRECCFAAYITPMIWWMVDLGSLRRIHIVDIAPANGFLFANVVVRVGEELMSGGMLHGFQILGSYPHTEGLPRDSRFRVSHPEGIVGRYVLIEQNHQANLVLCDVMVLVSD